MRPRTRDLLIRLGAVTLAAVITGALVGGALTLARAATTTLVTDAPCTYTAGLLDCRATQPPPPPPPPPPPVGDCSSFSTVLRATWDWSSGNRTIDTSAMGGIGAASL